MKKRTKAAFIAVMSLVPAGIALASATLPTPTPTPVAFTAEDRSRRLNTLKTQAAAEIDRRLSRLQSVAARLDTSSHMASSDRDAMKALVASQTSALGTLKSNLAAETDLAKARVMVQALVDQYKDYGLTLPKISLATSADRLMASSVKLQTVLDALQVKSDTLAARGVDVSAVTKSLEQAKAAMIEAKPRYETLPATVLKPTAADYVAAHKTLTGYQTDVEAARKDFETVRSAIDKAAAEIDKLGKA